MSSTPATAKSLSQNSLDVKLKELYKSFDTLPYDVETQRVDAVLKDAKGNIIFEKKNVEAPKSWSQLSINIAAEKYMVKSPADRAEYSVRTMCERVAFDIAATGVHNNYLDLGNMERFKWALARLLENQYFCFNSPVWFNVGVGEGRPTISACFILGIEDSMKSILECAKTEGMIYKSGSGSGINYSPLRGKCEPLSRGGHSSGVMSFIGLGDAVAGAIKSGGTTRRAAKMVILNVDHPDIEEFIEAKTIEEKKAKALIEAGFDGDFRSENGAYATVNYQNANHSVRVTDKFMQAVEEDDNWHLLRRGDSESWTRSAKKVKARDLFRSVTEAAWRSGDPGLQFDTEINKWNTLQDDGRINGSNPCVTGDTLVATINGLVRIDSILDKFPNVGIIGLNGFDYECKPAFKTGHKPVYKLTTSAGYSLNLTGDHQVWTENRGDVKACELTKDDIVKLMPGIFGRKNISDDLILLIGLALGDGCISQDIFTLVMNSANELDILNDAARILNSLKEENEDTKESKVNTTSGRLTSGAVSIINKLNEYAILDEYSEGKLIKDNVFGLSKNNIASLLRGLFTADGTVANYGDKSQYIALDSCALPLLQQVQLLLLQFGIKSKLYKNRRAGKATSILPDGNGGLKEYSVLEMHSLRISKSSRILFEKEIGFHSASLKAIALKELNEEVSTYKDSLTDTIDSLEYIGLQDVYDLTEPNTNHFVANGIAVHNCSEYMSLDNTSCNLASINLMKFYIDGKFNYDLFEKVCEFATICLDILITNASYPTETIAKNVQQYRQIGLGYANLGTLLMVQGIAYDSDEGRKIARRITEAMTRSSYKASVEMAKQLDSFSAYERNKTSVLEVLNLHAAFAADYHHEGLGYAPWEDLINDVKEHGVRNSYVTNIAPTGTIGLVMGCDTTGIEPELALIKYKKLVGGGVEKIVNGSVTQALKCLKYTDEQIIKVLDYIKETGSVKGCDQLLARDNKVFATSFDPKGNYIAWKGHVDMMAAVQPFLSGSISKTVNMERTATVEDVEAAYKYAWKNGLKCIAIYRDGCKESQPLTTQEKKKDVILPKGRSRLPDDRPSLTHKFDIAGHEGYMHMGLFEDGSLGELFITISKEGSFVSGLIDNFATMFSIALQHGAPLELLIGKMKGHTYDPQGITKNKDIRIAKSITDYVARYLEKKFILSLLKEDKEVSSKENIKVTKDSNWGDACMKCGGVTQQSGTCRVCTNCSETTGCS